MELKDLSYLGEETNAKMPVLFLGHGSPMNAIEDNAFVKGFREVGSVVQRPKAILCISAHWETYGTKVTAMEMPKTIHDFGGFPQALYDVQYPAPGSPELARMTQDLLQHDCELDHHWGLDHGAWSVIKHMYPEADVPVVQMSLNRYKTPAEHIALAKELQALRRRGVLIVGSGNMVHNLRMVAWDRLNDPFGYDWAQEANARMKTMLVDSDLNGLAHYSKWGKAFENAVPTPEHYLPLLYAIGLREEEDNLSFFNDEYLAGAISMTSVMIGG